MTINRIKSSKPVVVIGMHRSGTSVVSSLVYRLGIHLGDDLLGSSYSNPSGHFEDLDFLDIHDAILKDAGGDWDSPPDIERLRKSFKKHEGDIDSILFRKAFRGNRWGWKEPRTSLLLPFYRRKLPDMKIIYCQRDAEEVAASLQNRNKFSRAYAKKLTNFYEESINYCLKSDPGLHVLVVKYSEIIEIPDNVALRICSFLGISTKLDLSLVVADVMSRGDVKRKSKESKEKLRRRLLVKGLRFPFKALRVVIRKVVRWAKRIRWNLAN